ncbi:MAG: ribosome-associated translation inhibitor RaiA [Actinobacteria bacterium]|nr:ribosome-associated translation inhibitor RaiA [Actinomycetota bacterium]MCL6104773.1 ribosome-associated translation inhibitor RaiA [Actinomycetota bacterium]
MNVIINAKKADISEEAKDLAKEKVEGLSRLFPGAERAEIRFQKERNPRITNNKVCEVTLLGHGLVLRTSAAASDPESSIEGAVHKLQHRLEKLKGHLVARNHPRKREHKPV